MSSKPIYTRRSGDAVKKDLTGQRFGRLIPFIPLRKDCGNRKESCWLCICDCGELSIVITTKLLSGQTVSCGCRSREARRENLKYVNERECTVGLTSHPLYKTWASMMHRCYASNSRNYRNYGGRGIYVCERWHDLRNFIKDIGDRPQGKTLDRINNNGPYSPENCRWATTKEQARNKRSRYSERLITFQGQTLNIKDWSDKLGIKYVTLIKRLNNGWPVEKALIPEVNEIKSRAGKSAKRKQP